MAALSAEAVDRILLLQVTFTDASMTARASELFDQPLSIWAVGEPRAGGRLRLNAFCGLNLASHALSLRGREFSWLYGDPDGDIAADLDALLTGRRTSGRLDAADAGGFATPEGRQVADALKGRTVARIGAHPAGFDTCAYSPDSVAGLTGVKVDALDLDDLFSAARSAADGPVQNAYCDCRCRRRRAR